VRTSLIVLFLSAGLAKLRHPRGFVAAVRNYHLLPPRLTPIAAWSLCAIELALGCVLLAGVLQAVALVTSGCVLLGLAGVSLIVTRRSGNVECGCLGRSLHLRLDPYWALATCALGGAALIASTLPYASVLSMSGAHAPLSLVAWMSGTAIVVTYWLIAYGRSISQLLATRTGSGS
jgi:hypothetical protein